MNASNCLNVYIIHLAMTVQEHTIFLSNSQHDQTITVITSLSCNYIGTKSLSHWHLSANWYQTFCCSTYQGFHKFTRLILITSLVIVIVVLTVSPCLLSRLMLVCNSCIASCHYTPPDKRTNTALKRMSRLINSWVCNLCSWSLSSPSSNGAMCSRPKHGAK